MFASPSLLLSRPLSFKAASSAEGRQPLPAGPSALGPGALAQRTAKPLRA